MARVLVVDDDPGCRELVEEILDGEHEVVTAEDGEMALRAVAESAPDLMLLDLLMPGLDGIEVCRRIRRDPRNASLPIILLTAVTDTEARVRGKEAGVDQYLSKPYDRRELLAGMRRLLRGKEILDEKASEVVALRGELLRADRLAMLGSLAGSVGHELNNVATVLGSAVVAVTSADGVAVDVVEDLAKVREHVTAHARTLLRLGKPGNDKTHPVDLMASTLEVAGMLARSGRSKFLDIRVRASGDVGPVEVNPVRLEQVLVNLLANASDALAERRGDAPRILVLIGRRDDGRIACAIRDNAGGIPPEVLARIFEPYFTTKGPERGTGLGLPVVKQIVESYGGTLRVDSTPGAGSTFTFDLPPAELARERVLVAS